MAKKIKGKPKRKPSKRQPREDFIQATHRVFQEVIRRSEEIPSATKPPASD
jgi:hypothetical protein